MLEDAGATSSSLYPPYIYNYVFAPCPLRCLSRFAAALLSLRQKVILYQKVISYMLCPFRTEGVFRSGRTHRDGATDSSVMLVFEYAMLALMMRARFRSR